MDQTERRALTGGHVCHNMRIGLASGAKIIVDTEYSKPGSLPVQVQHKSWCSKLFAEPTISVPACTAYVHWHLLSWSLRVCAAALRRSPPPARTERSRSAALPLPADIRSVSIDWEGWWASAAIDIQHQSPAHAPSRQGDSGDG